MALVLLSLLSALGLTGFQTNLLDAQFPQSLGRVGGQVGKSSHPASSQRKTGSGISQRPTKLRHADG